MSRMRAFWALITAGVSPTDPIYWRINPGLFRKILKSLPKKGTLLELGSGEVTDRFAKHFTVYSIEHDPAFVNKSLSHYIHAPIVDGWYCRKTLEEQLPKHYDGILVDGPPKKFGRAGLLTHLDLFDTSGYLFFDDVERKEERHLVEKVAEKIGRSFKIYKDISKEFAVFDPATSP